MFAWICSFIIRFIEQVFLYQPPPCYTFYNKTVQRAGHPIKLAPREYALLEYLAMRQGEVVSRRDIEAHLYDEQADPMSNVVDAAVCTLRRKITRPGEPPLIHTRPGLGYVLELKPA